MPVIPPQAKAAVVATTPQAIVGIMRFSLLLEDSNFFPNLKGMGRSDRVKNIFETARLMRRFEVFEQICLPSLRAQNDQNFNMILVTSQDLPQWARDRLSALVENLPNIYVRAYRTGANIQRIYKRSAFEMLDDTVGVTATFRLDDDDALSVGFIAQLRRYLMPENIGKIVTFPSGYQLELTGKNLSLQHDNSLNASAGLAAIHLGGVVSVPKIQTIYTYGAHRHVHQITEVIADASDAHYIQTANGFNVSERQTTGAVCTDIRDILDTLKTGFPYLTETALKNLFCVSR